MASTLTSLGYRRPSRGPENPEVTEARAYTSLELQADSSSGATERPLTDHVWITEQFADHKSPMWLDHAAQLPKSAFRVWDLAQDSDKVGAVEAGIGVGQAASIALRGLDVRHSLLCGYASCVLEHLWLEVADVQGARGRQPPCSFDGVVAGARADL